MTKVKTIYTCQKCSAQFPKWAGQCAECGAWNSIVEEIFAPPATSNKNPRFAGFVDATSNKITMLSAVDLKVTPRISTNIQELDRVLGAGLTKGSVILVGGDPGVGKSTLLLQTLVNLSKQQPSLYVTGEESLQQVAMRAQRLDLNQSELLLLAETNVERIIKHAQQVKPSIVVIDSIQTTYTEMLQSAPGGVSQVRESAAQLVRFAKQTNIALFLVGHVTKDGTLAGPRVLEHMVDTVLYFEGERFGRYRVIRAIKNRFGAVNELGVFAMTDTGLREVNNPSALFLSRNVENAAGSVVMATWEGSRPLLVEVQALVDESHLGNPRRVTVGLEQNRLSMLLAVLHRHGGVPTYDQDVFVNVVGGVKVVETAADLALISAVISSLRNRPLSHESIIFGEVGLSGEIRPVQNGQERLKEAAKHGFKHAIVPFANAPKKAISGMKVTGVKTIVEAISCL